MQSLNALDVLELDFFLFVGFIVFSRPFLFQVTVNHAPTSQTRFQMSKYLGRPYTCSLFQLLSLFTCLSRLGNFSFHSYDNFVVSHRIFIIISRCPWFSFFKNLDFYRGHFLLWFHSHHKPRKRNLKQPLPLILCIVLRWFPFVNALASLDAIPWLSSGQF